jgi:hypothetical protein
MLASNELLLCWNNVLGIIFARRAAQFRTLELGISLLGGRSFHGRHRGSSFEHVRDVQGHTLVFMIPKTLNAARPPCERSPVSPH